MNIWVRIAMCALSSIFILSGVSKAINIPAFAYEVRMYSDAYLMDCIGGWSQPIAVVVCALEILVGLLALRTHYMKISCVAMSVLLSFFVWLTGINYFYPSIMGSIESCGCFGELIHFSPLASFIKSAVLGILAICIMIRFLCWHEFWNANIMLSDRYFYVAIVCGFIPPVFSLFAFEFFDQFQYVMLYSILCVVLCGCLWFSYKCKLSRLSKKLAIINVIVFCACGVSSCGIDKVQYTLERAVENRVQLDSVLNHYADDDPRQKAAEFLVANMYDKYWYEGEVLDRYDEYFSALKKFREVDSITSEEDPRVRAVWDTIVSQYGLINTRNLSKAFDCQRLSAQFIIENIDIAWQEFGSVPSWADSTFEAFLEYVLPYRVIQERPTTLRREFVERFHLLRDTTETAKDFLLACFNTFKYGKEHFSSNTLKKYPVDLSLDQIERGRYGTCRQNALYCVSVMRALGIPSTIDYVNAWGNRSSNHFWPVMMLKDGGIYPFNPYFPDTCKFDYKPAKIFRETFSTEIKRDVKTLIEEVPIDLWNKDFKDVSDQYGKTFDISIPCESPNVEHKYSYGVICVFDNKEWIPVWYGPFKNGQITFSKMLGDIVYMAAFYDHGKLLPASQPFVLTNEGEMKYFQAAQDTCTLVLKRKYPRFPRMESFALESRWARVEGSNTPDFRHKDTLYLQSCAPVDITDTAFTTEGSYRYFRWVVQPYRRGDLAEIEFYGKNKFDGEEKKLSGRIFGLPKVDAYDPHPYTMAMDGNPDTYYRKPKGDFGWVGIDLGPGKKANLTRLRFCPRSDTNFILQGDTYELFYWSEEDQWKSHGQQVANQDYLIYRGVPSNALYWLRDLTKGREERIFTYEEESQVWW